MRARATTGPITNRPVDNFTDPDVDLTSVQPPTGGSRRRRPEHHSPTASEIADADRLLEIADVTDSDDDQPPAKTSKVQEDVLSFIKKLTRKLRKQNRRE